MKQVCLKLSLVLAAVLMGMIVAGTALADKPSWAGGGKEKRKEMYRGDNWKQDRERGGDYDKSGRDGKRHRYFTDDQRVYIKDYYGARYYKGHCPPGLAKKHNGCMPPGQAKKWAIGRPLPRNVIYYDLPPGSWSTWDRHRHGTGSYGWHRTFCSSPLERAWSSTRLMI